MTFPERLRLLAFGLFTWSVSLFVAADPQTIPPIFEVAAFQSGLGMALFVIALISHPAVGFSR